MGEKFCGMLDSLWPRHIYVVDHAFMLYLSTLHMSGAFFGSFKHGRSSVIFYLGDGERLPCLNTSTKYRDIYLGCWNMR